MRATAIILIVFIISGIATPLFAQEYYAPPGSEVSKERSLRPQQAEENGKSNGIGWIVIHTVWISILGILFYLFRSARYRKQMVPTAVRGTDSDSKNDKSKIFTQKQLNFIKTLFVILGVMFFFLFIWGPWWAVSVLLIFLGVIVFSYWDATMEVLQSRKSDSIKTNIIVKEKTTFKDIGGLEEVIEELKDVVSLYKNPKEAEWWDIRLPKGLLLIGPPGCGKTLLARAIAGEAGLVFFTYSGAQIGTSYVRSGAQHIKAIFEEASAKAPCVLFFDEIDALGRKRGMDASGEFDHALTELLHEMDGVQKKTGILVLAATNREDILDEALLRPGRFDKKILVPNPDVRGRENILKIHTAKKRLAEDIDLFEIAQRTAGFNGATLEQVTNEAAQLARRRYEEKRNSRGTLGVIVDSAKELFTDPEATLTLNDFEEAILRVQMGPGRKLIMSEEERRIIAQHEIGHAIVTIQKGLDVLDKVTIMPRNWALGLTMSHAQERQLLSKAFILARITSILGGRAAEEVFLGSDHITTGAGNDLTQAAELARRMVCEWGMGELGPVIFYASDLSRLGLKALSEHTASRIDREVEKIILASFEEARKIITEKKETVQLLSDLLLERMVLTAKEIKDILDGTNENQKPH